jgi:hypothetical protein
MPHKRRRDETRLPVCDVGTSRAASRPRCTCFPLYSRDLQALLDKDVVAIALHLGGGPVIRLPPNHHAPPLERTPERFTFHAGLLRRLPT